MWIIPRPLHTSDFVPDTAALSLDSTESSEICARSLFVRSKPSPARTWSQKWKRDSWTALLSGRILRPSHGQSFVTAWTSSLVATHASHLAQPESDSAQKTLGTSGHLSQTEFGFSDPSSASLKMSKDTSASDSEKSLESWKALVIKARGEYSARVKSARLTSASGSSSWPTIRASEYKDVGPVGSKSHDHMLGKHYLCAVETQEEVDWRTPTTEAMGTGAHMDSADLKLGHRVYNKNGKVMAIDLNRQMDIVQRMESPNWPTPAVMDTTGGSYKTEWKDGRAVSYHNHTQENPVAYGAKLADAVKYGQAAPASSSSLGSRQGLWPTITAHTPDMESNGPNGHTGTYLAGAVKQWATPNNFCFQPPENTEQWTKRAEYQQTEKGVNLHKPIQSQVLHENEKVMGAMPPSAAKLNPRWVETLMGLPVGWTMPSCASPVTIELTSCASSATESCQQQQSELF